jgi:hypothetical protein
MKDFAIVVAIGALLLYWQFGSLEKFIVPVAAAGAIGLLLVIFL